MAVAPAPHPAVDPRIAARRIRTGVLVANINAWSLALGVVLALALGFLHYEGLVLAAALAVSTALEFRGARMLARHHPRAPRALATNQFALIALAWAYCLWRFFAAISGTNPILDQALDMMKSTGQIPANDPQAEADIRALFPIAAGILYGVLAIAVTLVCGLTAWFYLSRRAALASLSAGSNPMPNA